jgi:Cof subfamily protein (haloacid dehalogenase superfamily)
MGYKLICIDLDGTLLNSRRQITAVTKVSLRRAHELGVNIVISTGRIYTDAVYYANLIGVKSPVLASNGAYIKAKDEAGVIYQNGLGEALSFKILDVCNRYRVTPHFYTAHKEYYGSRLFQASLAWDRLKPDRRPPQIGTERKYIGSQVQWRQMIAAEKDHLVKGVILNLRGQKLWPIRKELLRINELEVTSSGSNNIELNCKGVSKGKGVAILTRYYNLKPEEVMVIGDGENDLAMIEYAGWGVAMGNATDIVKKQADYITDSNDHDGVAKVIDKFVLKPMTSF